MGLSSQLVEHLSQDEGTLVNRQYPICPQTKSPWTSILICSIARAFRGWSDRSSLNQYNLYEERDYKIDTFDLEEKNAAYNVVRVCCSGVNK